ncbi:MAG: HEAT repeat domain-containing protein, partial [Deltaproteobacteria bacterium]
RLRRLTGMTTLPLIAALLAAAPAPIRSSSELLAQAEGDDVTASRAAIDALASRPDGVPLLDRCLRELGSASARCALGLANARPTPAAFTVALESVEPRTRALAAWALASSTEAPSLDALSGLAVDPAPAVRAAAALGLGRLGAAAVPILRTLVDDRDPAVRSAAAEPLAEILSPDELAALATRTADDDAVRPRLMTALPRLPRPAALGLLLAGLRHGSADERRQAIEQLARFDDPRAFDALMQVASRDPDATTRRRASELLGN